MRLKGSLIAPSCDRVQIYDNLALEFSLWNDSHDHGSSVWISEAYIYGA